MSSELIEIILLPTKGLKVPLGDSSDSTAFFCNLKPVGALGISRHGAQPRFEFNIEVLDSLHGNGAKLCRIHPSHIGSMSAKYPGLRVAHVSHYTPALKRAPAVHNAVDESARLAPTIVRVISESDGKPVPRAVVSAFTDFENRIGLERTTNNRGEVHLPLGHPRNLDRLYVEPKANYWSFEAAHVPVRRETVVRLQPIDLAHNDCLRFFYGHAPLEAGEGVKVGIVDSGIHKHRDLRIDGGVNTVRGENPDDIGDSGLGHGTHVAGIVAARGRPGTGVRGLSPGVTLRGYRVFGKGKPHSTNFAIAKAIDQAVEDGCDLINISLVDKSPSVVTSEAIEDALSRGTLVIAAAGNDGHEAVSFPAAEPLAIAVSALGRRRTFPRSSSHRDDIAPPFGEDSNNFFASFSNVGPQVDLIGPGVAIISTHPRGYAAWDGTSMACPAATGAIARLLSADSRVLSMPRTQARAEAIAELAFRCAVRMGFGQKHEGHGRINFRQD